MPILKAPATSLASASSGNAKVVMVGAEVPCAVQTAQDFDTYTQTINGVVIRNYGVDGPLTYKWSADMGSFKNGSDGQSVIWIAPKTPGRYTLKCTIDDPDGPRVALPDTGSHDDNALVRSCQIIVPTLSIQFVQNTLAIGSKDNDAHKAKFEVKVTDDTGSPLSNFTIPKPTIVEGTGRDPHDGTSARVEMESLVTNSSGIVKGKLKSGNRLETTKIRIQTDPSDPQSGPSAGADQVWSDLGDDAWEYEPYFGYGEASSIKYRMAYTRDDVEEKITGHSMEPETTSISGYEWDASAGEDWDEDGSPDGDYQDATYSIEDADSSGYDAWSGLVEWGSVSESDGTYAVPQTIKYDEDFVLDSVQFWLLDNDSYAKDGAQS